MCRIFVYGSLKRGQLLHEALNHQKFVGFATTRPEYALYDCGEYPALVKVATNGDAVKGELYDVDLICLRKLDELEGVDEGLYSRAPVRLASQPGNSNGTDTIWAWFYLKNIQSLPRCGTEWP